MRNYNIPVFVPHEGCPFNCIFCNQKRITGSDTSMTANRIREIIEEQLETLPKTDRYIEVAFFGGSFTGISAEKQCEFLSVAQEYKSKGVIDGIRLSTRPDYISEEILERLAFYGVTSIEIGVQSMDDEVLKKTCRGHTPIAVMSACEMIKKRGFRLGLQMMTGLPGDTDEKALKTAEKIIAIEPDFVRIYPTLVIKDTPLEKMYKNGDYTPPTLDEAIGLCKKLLVMFEENNIDVIRVALVTTEEISEDGSVVAGPFHPAFRELAEGEIFYDRICAILGDEPDCNCVAVNPHDVSRAVGHRRRNIIRIKQKYGIDLKIKAFEGQRRGTVKPWKDEK